MGVPIAPSVFVEKGKKANIESIMQEKGWKKGVIKPLVGCDSRESLRFENTTEDMKNAQEHADRLLENEGLVIQCYLSKVES